MENPAKVRTAWTGGLGKLMNNDTQVLQNSLVSLAAIYFVCLDEVPTTMLSPSPFVFHLQSIYPICLQAWVCMARNFSDNACPSPPQDYACYVFNEATRRFAYWGRDSYLQLTGLIPAT
jgi:hypothetical protein